MYLWEYILILQSFKIIFLLEVDRAFLDEEYGPFKSSDGTFQLLNEVFIQSLKSLFGLVWHLVFLEFLNSFL